MSVKFLLCSWYVYDCPQLHFMLPNISIMRCLLTLLNYTIFWSKKMNKKGIKCSPNPTPQRGINSIPTPNLNGTDTMQKERKGTLSV